MKTKTTFYEDSIKLSDELLIYRRADVSHDRFYARIAIPGTRKYKVIALSTEAVEQAKSEALTRYAETKFAIKNEIAIFRKSFDQVAKEFLEKEKARSGLSGNGGTTKHRYRVLENHYRVNLSKYVGKKHVNEISAEDWINYAAWRQQHGKGRSGGLVSKATIRSEMACLRSIMNFAALRGYVSESKIKNAFSGRYMVSNEKRDAFTRTEYQTLYRFMRTWAKEEKLQEVNRWTREMVRNFILIMANTGMRNSESRALRWADVFFEKDRDRVIFTVSGKSKRRTFEADGEVWKYLERIREMSKATGKTDFVFSTYEGKQSKQLYVRTIHDLLDASGLAISSSGKRRSTYSLRHSFATWRLQAGADVYSLAQVMGTSIEMIQQSYGHISSRDASDSVLRGMGKNRDKQSLVQSANNDKVEI